MGICFAILGMRGIYLENVYESIADYRITPVGVRILEKQSYAFKDTCISYFVVYVELRYLYPVLYGYSK